MENTQTARNEAPKFQFLVDATGKPLPGSSDWFVEYLAELDSKRTQIPYTEADKDAVQILRAAYLDMESAKSDLLYDARQYLQDRARYERLHQGVAK